MADKKNPKTLKDIRKKIDQLDLAILRSLSERVDLVIQAGEIKKKNNDNSFYKPERAVSYTHLTLPTICSV